MNNLKAKFSVRTDLAIEARELLMESGSDLTEGIITEFEEYETINLTKVSIVNDKAAEEFGKPIGTYITLETQKMKTSDVSCHEKIIEVLAKNLNRLIKIKPNDTVLVIGLGNWNITPDAVGPKVVSKMLVTRNMEDSMPEEIGEIRSVAALSPGVMGITGIETVEVVKGLVEHLKPSLVIAVDALAARKMSRLNATIQLTDTGISPGSGVGNKRAALNKDSLGVDVIAIGVPTVVDAATLVNDAMDRIIEDMMKAVDGDKKEFYEVLMHLKDDEKYGLIRNLLEPYEENMFVTPKDVDLVINRISGIIANGLNIALQPNLTKEDINRFMNE